MKEIHKEILYMFILVFLFGYTIALSYNLSHYYNFIYFAVVINITVYKLFKVIRDKDIAKLYTLIIYTLFHIIVSFILIPHFSNITYNLIPVVCIYMIYVDYGCKVISNYMNKRLGQVLLDY